MLISLYLVSVFPNKPVCFWRSIQHVLLWSSLSPVPWPAMETWFSLFTSKGETRPHAQWACFVTVQGSTRLCRAPLFDPGKRSRLAAISSLTQEEGWDWLPSSPAASRAAQFACGSYWQTVPSQLAGNSSAGLMTTFHCPYASSLHSWKRNSPDVLGTEGVPTVEPFRIFSLPWGVSGAVKRMPACWGSSLLRIQHGLWVRVACSHTSGEHVNHLLQLEEIFFF